MRNTSRSQRLRLITNLFLISLIQIQANENEEKFCPEILQRLAQKVANRKGQLLIIGSTNDGATGFNTKVWNALKSLPKTKFCKQEEARTCVKEAVDSIR